MGEIKDFFAPEHPGRPPKHDRRAIYNAIRYAQRADCQWRPLPTGINAHRRRRVRGKADKAAGPSVAILDSQTVKTVQRGGTASTAPS